MTKSITRRVANRVFHFLARSCPGSTSLRPMLHRLRGIGIGRNVLIGDGVYLENEWPERIEIHDNVQISIRVIVIAHTRGPGRVIIEKEAFVGPNSVLVCGGGRVLRIGAGAVIGAGSVITKSVPPKIYVAPAPLKAMARVKVPLAVAESMETFWAGLEPLERSSQSQLPREPA